MHVPQPELISKQTPKFLPKFEDLKQESIREETKLETTEEDTNQQLIVLNTTIRHLHDLLKEKTIKCITQDQVISSQKDAIRDLQMENDYLRQLVLKMEVKESK